MRESTVEKIRFRTALIVALASAGLVLGACDGDDDDNNDDNNDNNMTDVMDDDTMEDDVMDDDTMEDDTMEEDVMDDDTMEEQFASVQVIHASPDPAAATVDVWVEGVGLVFDDFDFRTAQPFANLPAGVPLNIGIAGSDSASYEDSLKTWEGVTFTPDAETVVIAHGLVAPEGDEPELDLLVIDGKTTPDDDSADELNLVHAAIAPAVDIVLDNDADNAISGVTYGASTGYAAFANGITTVDVLVSDSGMRAASFQTPDLAGGTTWVVIATGFVAPEEGSGEPAFGLHAFGTDGTVLELDQAARAQLIHASPSAAADPVDIYLNGEEAFADVPFRASTGFLTVPSGVDLNWDIVPDGAALADSVASATTNFDPAATAIAAAVGGGQLGFSIVPKLGAREMADDPTKVDLTVLHASVGAPAVDIGVDGALTAIADDLAFGSFTDGYFTADAAAVDVLVSADGTELFRYPTPLDTLTGAALTVVATGFLEPEGNQPGFEVRVYTGDAGEGVELTATTP